jgi:methyl-accepting chemotaxis protein
MKHWTVGKKLISSFLAVAVITAMLGGVGYYGTVKSNEALNEIGVVRLPSVQNLMIIAHCAEKIKAAQRTLLSPDLSLADRKRQPETVAKTRETYGAAWKVYEPLPQTVEEAAIWKQFVPAWEQWCKDNDAFFKLNNELSALAILNPPALQRDLQQFIGDHHKLEVKLLNHVLRGGECTGGDDPTACNFGRWLAKFDSANPDLKRIIDATRPSHDAFHVAVRNAKELAAKNDRDGALNIIHGEMEKSAAKTFEGFAGLLATADKAAELRDKMDHQLMTDCRASQTNALGLLDKLVEINESIAADTTKVSVKQAAILKFTSLATMIVVIAAALALGILITRSINKVLNRISASLSDGADQTTSAAGQVSSASQSLAEGASEQAASIEETSSSLEEMSSMTQRNAENAQKANDLARMARTAAERGSADMQAMTVAMDAIKASSDDIAKIIRTIDEIAFQTNILALNAAVEAARAGEAGMGFAVVADEVRNLAQRSAQAAKETSAKIEGAISRTAQGVDLSAKVATTLAEIVTQARQVDELAAEVANASREQSQGVAQINVAVGQMDKVTQSNAANAEESAAAAEELNAQAEMLKSNVVDLMRLVNGSSVAATTVRPPASTHKARNLPVRNEATPAAGHRNGNGHAHTFKNAASGSAPVLVVARKASAIPLEDGFKNF